MISPLRSATKTRPSAAKRSAVGLFSPWKAITSSKPAGSLSDVVRKVLSAPQILAPSRIWQARKWYSVLGDRPVTRLLRAMLSAPEPRSTRGEVSDP